jgi:hypothetical protein
MEEIKKQDVVVCPDSITTIIPEVPVELPEWAKQPWDDRDIP